MLSWSEKLIFFLVFSLSAAHLQAADYYVSPAGSDANSGTTAASPWQSFSHAYSYLSPGDTLYLLDGIYTETLNPAVSGAAGSPITFKAVNRGRAIIAKQSDGYGILVESSPGNIRSYLIFDGIIARSHGEYDAIYLNSADNSTEQEMTHHITVKNCGAFGSANLTNTMSFKISRVRDSLVEDSWTYGFGRKAMQIYGSIRVNVRRMVARYDYWDGADYKPNDPRIGFAVYNSKDGIYENIIVLDCAPDPPGRISASKAGFAIEGNVSSTSLVTGSVNNQFLGIISLNNDHNGFYISGISSGQNNSNKIENFSIWNSGNNGMVIHAYASYNTFVDGTVASSDSSGVRINNTSVTDNNFIRLVSMNNSGYGFYFQPGGSGNVLVDSTAVNNDNPDIEANYLPVYNYLPDPKSVSGYERGGRIVNRYVNGILTTTPLWPWPNEDLIRENMCNAADLAATGRVAVNGVGWEPEWCASGKSLTTYIWEYLGHQIPDGIVPPNGDHAILLFIPAILSSGEAGRGEATE